MRTRTERDSMGEVEVPEDALYGAQTRRAILNFPVSGWPLPSRMIKALGLIKRAAAQTNFELGKTRCRTHRLDRERSFRSNQRQALPALPHRRLPDRQCHLLQYECQ